MRVYCSYPINISRPVDGFKWVSAELIKLGISPSDFFWNGDRISRISQVDSYKMVEVDFKRPEDATVAMLRFGRAF